MSSAALTYLGLVKTAIVTLTGGVKPLVGWTVQDTIPGDSEPVDVSKHVLFDLAEEGEAVLSDGSGYGCVLVILVAATTAGTTYAAARTLVADAVDAIREVLRDPTSKCRPDKVHVSYSSPGMLYSSPVYMATIEIEKRLA